MLNSLFPKRIAVGLLSLGAIAFLSACGEPDTVVETTDEAVTSEESVSADPNYSDETAPEASAGTIVDVAASDESFSILVQAVKAAGLAETLSAEGPYTVFAPTNEAFEALPPGTLDQLLQPENQQTLAQILSYHVVPQDVPSSAISTGEVNTVAGSPLEVTVDGASVMVNNASVIQADIEASNGVIHAVDQVILPPDAQL